MNYLIEEVYKTEGVPEFTFVRPPNYNEMLVDIRNPGKPVIIEGQSGTGKTTVAKKILDHAFPNQEFTYLTARKASDVSEIIRISNGEVTGRFIVDDFHRLDNDVQERIANLIKIAAEEFDPAIHPKIVIVGINKVGSELIYLVHDIAKRCGIHKVMPANENGIAELIQKGEEKLHVKIGNTEKILIESAGDYWLAQLLCQSICMMNDVIETSPYLKELTFDQDQLRKRLVSRLENNYSDPVKEFCRGKRFRSSNDPYYKLLRLIGTQDSSIVDLNELANAYPEFKGSINNIKERRISVLLESKPICEKYFYYNQETKNFAIEDPALFYYLKHLEWDVLRRACGFRDSDKDYDFDFAISFAGENRALAKNITDLLSILDCTVFYDEYFEANYLGQAWSKQFNEIFSEKSRLVICLLDSNHKDKIWPTFERECFQHRTNDASVIPIYLDDTKFVGIPSDIVGIPYIGFSHDDDNLITDKIVMKLEDRLQAI
ncbi:TIR domain-containing protein [Vibrio furnissii]|uniref:TIR domain-containing protein n=2 Tax=Vibrio furnissii TaxID=29494 RepID=UPI0013022360|nr:TIR domain-containing protein [Vibrio furnissii]MCG6267856.1 TIR domain-containing protein [Vibrio furnissii]